MNSSSKKQHKEAANHTADSSRQSKKRRIRSVIEEALNQY